MDGGWGETEREPFCDCWSLFSLNIRSAGSAGDEILRGNEL